MGAGSVVMTLWRRQDTGNDPCKPNQERCFNSEEELQRRSNAGSSSNRTMLRAFSPAGPQDEPARHH
jgi:hypothetical protein